ncbi:MAG TPA: GNAT family N-acetyltransferase [Acidimicrobiales bacterium]|jgi:ribosomal protein S18 acetylase RimI-like enzyme|nr:GNAT family N-acetyltransferase [Acidimicrobiales bacterium]
MLALQIRPVRAEEHAALGELTVAAYAWADPRTLDDGYADELRDVAGRARAAVVLAAVDGATGEVLGGVTFVPDVANPLAEFTEPDAAGIRMLAVAPHARGRGVGEALTRACIDRARAGGRRQIVLHSTDRMTAAHRLYTRLGFERDPGIDWEPEPGLWLRGFRLRLDDRAAADAGRGSAGATG